MMAQQLEKTRNSRAELDVKCIQKSASKMILRHQNNKLASRIEQEYGLREIFFQ